MKNFLKLFTQNNEHVGLKSMKLAPMTGLDKNWEPSQNIMQSELYKSLRKLEYKIHLKNNMD